MPKHHKVYFSYTAENSVRATADFVLVQDLDFKEAAQVAQEILKLWAEEENWEDFELSHVTPTAEIHPLPGIVQRRKE